MLEIEPDHIAALDDTQLRRLVALLCEAELVQQGLSTSSVTAGGSQTASDGGLDVSVDLPNDAVKANGYVARLRTGFQVKAEDMPPSEIAKEMAPKGVLREAIRTLVRERGAYIIVSSRGTVAHRRLQERRQAMRHAVSGELDADAFAVDFYDRTRIASWVRDNPAVIAWVRHAIGQPIKGWQPYGAWSYATSAQDDVSFILDGNSRIRDARRGGEGSLSMQAGLALIRSLLGSPGTVVRLVGLSGTGKTRMVEALFDATVGEHALAPSLAHYTDMGNEPHPTPREVALQLEASKKRAIVVVDNCPPADHRSLADVCKGCKYVSTITVEYDVRDESIEDTDVFVLEPASEEVIVKLIRRRHPTILQPDAVSIASAAGGNARLALAIANALPTGKTLTGVPYNELFERLFHQRGGVDKELLRSACACALVYSFGTESPPNGTSELSVFASLVEITPDRLHSHIAELMERQLVQRRAHWRAVLPQALAAWLAERALKLFPLETIEHALVAPRGRLAQSHARRLGDLHENHRAQEIADRWLAPGGLLDHVDGLDDVRRTMLQNIAPVSQHGALAVLERSIAATNFEDRYAIYSWRRWVSLLRSLAYEADLFHRAVRLQVQIAAAEPRPANQISQLTSLFQICLSGTTASLEARINVLRSLFEQNGEPVDSIALECLRALLNVQCSAAGSFSFGARPRDFGYWPKTPEDVNQWYSKVLAFVASLSTESGRLRDRVKTMLATTFRELWTAELHCEDALEKAMLEVASCAHWSEGWIAVGNTLRRRSRKEMSPAKRQRLQALEEKLRPHGMREKAMALLTSKPWDDLDIAGDMETDSPDQIRKAHERTNATAKDLGREIARDQDLLNVMSGALVAPNAHRASVFGEGLAEGAEDPALIWTRLVHAFERAPKEERRPDVLFGYLARCADLLPALEERFQNEAVEHPALAPIYPVLQSQWSRGLKRLVRSAARHSPAAHLFRSAWVVPGSSEDFAELVFAIEQLEDGVGTASQVLYMRMHVQRTEEKAVDATLRRCGRELLRRIDFKDVGNDSLAHQVGEIIGCSLAGEENVGSARQFCERLESSLQDYRIPTYQCNGLLQKLCSIHPRVVLDVFFSGESNPLSVAAIVDDFPGNSHLLDDVPFDILREWTASDPERLIPRVASGVTAFDEKPNNGTVSWRPILLALEELTSDKALVYQAVESQFIPSGWSGSLADILERRLPLLTGLVHHADSGVRIWAEAALQRMEQRIAVERVRETKESTGFE